MKRWFLAFLTMGVLGAAGCAQGPYPAPAGSTIETGIESLPLTQNDVVIQLDAVVSSSSEEDEVQLLSNVRVSVSSLAPGAFVLVPESAISTNTAGSDTDWSCSAEDAACNESCDGLSGEAYESCHASCWAQTCGEEYYDWSNVDDTILPNYVETSTDNRGVARVYLWVRCLPTTCGSIDVTGAFEGCPQAITEGCSGLTSGLVFSTGVDTDVINITTSIQPPTE